MTMHHARIAQIEDQPTQRFERMRTKAEALPSLAEVIGSFTTAILFVIHAVDRRRKMQRDLRSMSEDQLRDVGLSRDEALRAAERIEWRGDWK